MGFRTDNGHHQENSRRPWPENWLYRPHFPEHWERSDLHSLAKWVNGLAFRNIEFQPKGMPVIKIAEIKNGITEQTKFTLQEFDESVRVSPKDMLFSWSGQPESSIDVSRWLGPDLFPGWLNQHIFRVTVDPGVEEDFFYYLLKYLNPNFVSIARNKQTTGLGHVTKKDLEQIEVALPVPPFRATGHCPHSRHPGRQDRTEPADEPDPRGDGPHHLPGLVRGLRPHPGQDGGPGPLPPDGTVGPVPSESGGLRVGMEIPKGWQVKSIETFADIASGKRPKERSPVASKRAQVPLWGGNGPTGFVPDALVDKPILLTGRVGTLGSVFRVTEPCWPSDNTLIVSPKNSLLLNFLYFQMKLIDFYILNRGSTQPLLTQTDLKSQLIASPPETIIWRFDEITRASFNKIEVCNSEIETLANHRDTLLPILVAGEILVLEK